MVAVIAKLVDICECGNLLCILRKGLTTVISPEHFTLFLWKTQTFW